MSPAKRFSKKQIKEDKLVTTAFKTSEYIQKNPKPFIIGGSVVAVIFIAVILMLWNADKERSESQGYFIRGKIAADSGMFNDAVMDLKTILDDYGNSPSAPNACYLLANLFFDNKNYEEALRYYTLMVTRYTDDKLKAAGAAAGAAACNIELDNLLEAAKFYKMAAELYPDELWAPEFLLKAGDNYAAAGDTEAASVAYNEIIDNYVKSRESNTAKRSLAEIGY